MALTRQFLAGETEATVLGKLNTSSMPVVTSVTDIAKPFFGQVIFNLADNAMYRYNGTQFVPLVGPQMATLLADFTVNNLSALSFAPDLVLPVVAGGSYILESEFIYDTNATADAKVNFATPASSGIRLAFWQDGTAASAIQSNLFHDAVDSALVTLGGVASGTMMTCCPTGWFINGPINGFIQVQFAQNVADPSNTTLKTGSWIRLTKI